MARNEKMENIVPGETNRYVLNPLKWIVFQKYKKKKILHEID